MLLCPFSGRPIDEYEFTYDSDEEKDQNVRFCTVLIHNLLVLSDLFSIQDDRIPDFLLQEITQTRYLLCPAAFSVYHLKKFVRMKFDLDDSYTVSNEHVSFDMIDIIKYHNYY